MCIRDRVRVVNDKEVQIFIKEDILISHADYEKLAESATGDDINPGPHLSFEMPSESLDRNLDRFYQQNPSFLEQNQPLLVEFKDEPNYFGDIIGWLAPIMLLLFFWLFIGPLRR